MKVTLFVRAPKKAEKRVVVERDVVIGRGKDCNLQILSNDVSRHHCRLVISESDVAVRDLGSGNGTLINNLQTEPNIDAPLSSGDIVRIGPLVIKVEFESATLQSEPPPAIPEKPSPQASNPIAEPADSREESTVKAVAESIDENPVLEPFFEPAGDDELLPDDDPAEGEVETSEFAEVDSASLTSVEPAVEDPPLSEQQPGKMKSLFGMFARKKKTEEPDTQTEATLAEEPSTELTADADPEPLLVADNADFEEETVVVDQENAFPTDEDEVELLADDEEGLSYEGDSLDDGVPEEAVDPGFADFLNNVDQPPT